MQVTKGFDDTLDNCSELVVVALVVALGFVNSQRIQEASADRIISADAARDTALASAYLPLVAAQRLRGLAADMARYQALAEYHGVR